MQQWYRGKCRVDEFGWSTTLIPCLLFLQKLWKHLKKLLLHVQEKMNDVLYIFKMWFAEWGREGRMEGAVKQRSDEREDKLSWCCSMMISLMKVQISHRSPLLFWRPLGMAINYSLCRRKTNIFKHVNLHEMYQRPLWHGLIFTYSVIKTHKMHSAMLPSGYTM